MCPFYPLYLFLFQSKIYVTFSPHFLFDPSYHFVEQRNFSSEFASSGSGKYVLLRLISGFCNKNRTLKGNRKTFDISFIHLWLYPLVIFRGLEVALARWVFSNLMRTTSTGDSRLKSCTSVQLSYFVSADAGIISNNRINVHELFLSSFTLSSRSSSLRRCEKRSLKPSIYQ